MTRWTRRPLIAVLLTGALVCAAMGANVLPTPLLLSAADPPTATPVTFDPAVNAMVPYVNLPTGLPFPLPTPAPATAVGAARVSGAAGADAVETCVGTGCIQHVVIIMLENQSFDRMFGTFTNPNSSSGPVEGLPTDTAGHFTSCLPDPRQPYAPPGVTLAPCAPTWRRPARPPPRPQAPPRSTTRRTTTPMIARRLPLTPPACPRPIPPR